MNSKAITIACLVAAIAVAPETPALAREHFHHHGRGPVLGLFGAVAAVVTAPFVILGDALSGPRYEREGGYDEPGRGYYRERRSYDGGPRGYYGENRRGYYGEDRRGYSGDEQRGYYRQGPRGNGYGYERRGRYDEPPRGYNGDPRDEGGTPPGE